MTIDDRGDPSPHAPRLPSDPPPPRRRQAGAPGVAAPCAPSAPESPSQDPDDLPDATTAPRAVVRAILGALPPAARALVAGVLLAWLRLALRRAAGAVPPAEAARAAGELFEALHGAGLGAPAEAAAGAWFGCGPGDLFRLIDCEPDVARLVERALDDLDDALDPPPGRPRLARLALDPPPRRVGPREAVVRGIAGALPLARARDALRGALAFLRALDGLDALARGAERASPDALGGATSDEAEASLRRAASLAGSLAEFGGRRRAARARAALVAAVIGFDPAHAARLLAEGAAPALTTLKVRTGVKAGSRELALDDYAHPLVRPRRFGDMIVTGDA